MTTFAFVAGMLPLVTSKGVGSGFSKAMASIVVGGQTLSLLLTLVAIPVIYTWFDDLSGVFRSAWIGLFGASVDRGEAEVGVVNIHAPILEPAPGPVHGQPGERLAVGGHDGAGTR
jgi:HAE1 family hydrophobic/amphiphilic exporter-1